MSSLIILGEARNSLILTEKIILEIDIVELILLLIFPIHLKQLNIIDQLKVADLEVYKEMVTVFKVAEMQLIRVMKASLNHSLNLEVVSFIPCRIRVFMIKQIFKAITPILKANNNLTLTINWHVDTVDLIQRHAHGMTIQLTT